MEFPFGSRIRHPFFPGLHATPARAAKSINQALYGTFEELESAWGAGARVRRAVFVTCRPADPLPGDSQRDALWDMFRVPVLAMLLDTRGRLLAFECEAQNGLHVNARHRVPSEDTAICA
ncbi:MAG TPA: hypothetical protein VGS58_03150, partial [Candidatus Sulfopaludibacter sp.]|nr:hypothetical protein [Candidatus Sulfopaludibacter sp.]